MSLETKWQIASPALDDQMVTAALPGLVDIAVKAMESKGVPYCVDSINRKVYDTYNGIDTSSRLLLCGPCLLLVTFGEVWWMPGFMLVEEAIYRFRPGDIKDTFEGLEQYARFSGMRRIVVGTAAVMGRREQAYARLLTRHGYLPTATQHTKEL